MATKALTVVMAVAFRRTDSKKASGRHGSGRDATVPIKNKWRAERIRRKKKMERL